MSKKDSRFQEDNFTFGSDFAKVDAHDIAPLDYDEAPELTDDMMKRGVWMRGNVVIPEEEGRRSFARQLRGRPRAAAVKKSVSIRLSEDVLAALKATGKGWQTRIEATLRASLGL